MPLLNPRNCFYLSLFVMLAWSLSAMPDKAGVNAAIWDRQTYLAEQEKKINGRVNRRIDSYNLQMLCDTCGDLDD